MRHLLWAALLVIASGCGEEGKKTGEPGKSASATSASGAASAKAPDGPFAAWDVPGRKRALQGAHLTPGDGLGSWVAWNVEGDKVTVWDGKAEKTYELQLTAPCELSLVTKSGGGSSSTTTHFTVKDGAILMGLGDAGSRKGPEAVACISNTIVTLDAKGTCLEWDESMFKPGNFESKPGTCAFAKDGDKEVFTAKVNGSDYKLLVEGDAIYSEQLKQTHSEKSADFAAAKTARDAKK